MASEVPPKKKLKPSSSKSDNSVSSDFLKMVEEDRNKTAPSVDEFKFNVERVKLLSSTNSISDGAEGIMYWMSRDQRVQDNWALLYAQKLALREEISLHVCFCLVPKFLDATIRHYDFLLRGLQEVAAECREMNIEFHLLLGYAVDVLPKFVSQNNIGAVVTDFAPLRVPRKWVTDVQEHLPKNVPFYQVDAHNIVPCWVASDKLEYAARTIRNKINSQLGTFLTSFPPVTRHPHAFKSKSKGECKEVNWSAAENILEIDKSVKPVKWATPGTKAGLTVLEEFCAKRLKNFSSKRNDPTADALSNLSPWIHFGQISVQRCILVVREHKSKYTESVNSFCEEAIVRRELADNFCFYNDNYDNLDGAYDWARNTLNIHRKDKRKFVYTREELEQAKTYDDLWNSAQLQLIEEGKMHGFLRMYWAKKILEWTDSPERALADAIYLNDRYSLDGRDPNGYVGCMWSICGIHDQGWREREIFGKIRYMNYEGCKRKFDVAAYVSRWGGKKHKYEAKK